MLESISVSHVFDVASQDRGIESVARSTYFAEQPEPDKAIDTYGTVGTVGTFGGCFGCFGTAGCCC
jgi:hypothetical protein